MCKYVNVDRTPAIGDYVCELEIKGPGLANLHNLGKVLSVDDGIEFDIGNNETKTIITNEYKWYLVQSNDDTEFVNSFIPGDIITRYVPYKDTDELFTRGLYLVSKVLKGGKHLVVKDLTLYTDKPRVIKNKDLRLLTRDFPIALTQNQYKEPLRLSSTAVGRYRNWNILPVYGDSVMVYGSKKEELVNHCDYANSTLSLTKTKGKIPMEAVDLIHRASMADWVIDAWEHDWYFD